MQNKTICITSSHYSPHSGGIETFTERLSNELSKKGHKVIVLTHNLNNHHKIKETQKDGTIIIRLDASLLLKGRYPVLKNNRNNKKIFEWLKSQHIDYFLINTRFYKLSTEAAKFANSLNIIPIVLDHGSAHLTLKNSFMDLPVKYAEHMITNRLKKYKVEFYGISNASYNWLKHFDIKPKGVIPNAINVKEFSDRASNLNIRKLLNLNKDDFIVYFVGRYIPEKGVLELLETANMLNNRKDIHFVFSGNGKLNNKISNSHLKNVHNMGNCSSAEVAAVMKQSDVMCLPSRSEGFCLTLLESAACKLPCIMTKVGVATDIYKHQKFGYVLNSINPSDIYNAILYMDKNRNEKLNIGNDLYNYIRENYNWETSVKKLLTAFNDSNDKK